MEEGVGWERMTIIVKENDDDARFEMGESAGTKRCGPKGQEDAQDKTTTFSIGNFCITLPPAAADWKRALSDEALERKKTLLPCTWYFM